jgi:phospholipid N-methyltransferase
MSNASSDQIVLQFNFNPIPEPQPASTTQPYSFNEHKTLKKRLWNCEIKTITEIQSIYQRIKQAEGVLIAELNQKTLKQLAPKGKPSGWKKEDVIRSIYNNLISTFYLKGFTWSPFEEKMPAAQDRHFANLTDEDLQQYNASIQAERDKQAKVFNNPETLSEYRLLVDLIGLDALTPAQKIRYDELQAERHQEAKAKELAKRAEVEAVQLDGVSMTLVESVHTKKNIPLWVVQISDRVDRNAYLELKKKAKMFGGWWSSFNRACSGFHFTEKEQAEKFMGLQAGNVSSLDRVLEKEVEKKDNTAARLHDVAGNLREKATEKLEQERKVNTARRARMAASAETDALNDLSMADTLDNLATAIESGEAKYLNGIKYKSHVETLLGLLRQAHNQAGRAQGLQHDLVQRLPYVVADIEYAEYPYPQVYKEHLLNACRFLETKKGAMRLAFKMKKRCMAAKNNNVIFQWERDITDLTQFISHLKANSADRWMIERLSDSLEAFKRVQDMGLTTAPELRAALREFLQFKGQARISDPIKAMERELIGVKIPGYFPTPAPVVERMLSLVNLRAGNTVLEPSAGKGNIADRIKALHPDVKMDCIELNYSLRDILKAKGHNLVGNDFLSFKEQDYHAIVMNPPFENFQDVLHVQHAYQCLKPGGRLVAIMSESPFFSSYEVANNFRQWFTAVSGWSEKLPEGSFMDSERSTGVNTRIVVITK